MAEYVRLRAPKEHGQTLQLPPVSEGASMVEANRSLSAGYPDELKSIRDSARKEIRSLALEYTQSYSNTASPASVSSDVIVMSGHQPTLFHPGVWFKNFVLDSVARAADATAINLVVDNDLGGRAEILFPTAGSEGQNFESLVVGSSSTELPYEMRAIVDREDFERAGERLSTSLMKFGQQALIDSLWPEVVVASRFLSLPASLAAGRHRLERKHGLRTLELPVSSLSASLSFAKFFELVAINADRFRQVYNSALRDFRKVNRIRSQSHPVPELQSENDYVEIPFWIWTRELPTRRKLFVRVSFETAELTDRGNWSMSLSRENFAAEFHELNRLESDTFIRPRALTTTMFSRMFASDLFIHGIGGAKYDQLGDEIAKQFFDVATPVFMTATATMKLPLGIPEDLESKITELKVELRSLRYHPERELLNDARAKRKRELVLDRPVVGSCKAWHDEIDAINLSMFTELEVHRLKAETELAELQKALPLYKLLNSREFSFALFPEELIGELKAMASM